MRIIAVWVIVCAIWSSTWIFIKLGLQDLPPFSFAASRFVVAIIVITLIMRIWKIPFPDKRRDWLVLAGTGFLTFCLNYGLLFWGEQFVSSGLAAVLQATIPAFGLVIAPFYLPEKITPLKISAIAVGLIGVTVIFYEQLQISGVMAFAGSAAIVAGAFGAAFANVLVKRFAGNLHPATLTAGQMICGFLPLALFSLAREGNPLNFNWTAQSVFAVFYLAIVGSIIAFWLYYWLLQRIEATKAMLVALVTPVVAVLIGAIFLNEELPRQTAIGGLLVLSSVSLVLFRKKNQNNVEETKLETRLAE